MAEGKRLERETCSRCGGSGHYSYCLRYGTTCFKCAGRKEVLTKRGAAAAAYLRSLRSKLAREVKVGDVVKMLGITGGADTYEAWVKIEKVEAVIQEGASLKDGVMVPYRMEMIGMEGKRGEMTYAKTAMPESLVELWLPKAERLRHLEMALAYQETLTKDGKPMKRPRKKESKP